jgi:hypothetical protein
MIDLHYNFTNRRARLVYDGELVLNWTTVGALSFTQYCSLFIDRLYVDGTDTGDIRVDDVCLEIINAEETLAWWRFEQSATNRIIERTGRFNPANAEDKPVGWESSPWDSLTVGAQNVENKGVLRSPDSGQARCSVAAPDFNRWTYEAILKVRTNDRSFRIMDWEDQETDASIHATIQQDQYVYFYATDSDSVSVDTYESSAQIPFDDQWHHLAVVNDGTVMSFFVDYQYAEGYLTKPNSDGTYQYSTNSFVYIGNFISSNIVFDECRITSKALTTNEFLQLSAPCISTVDASGAQWHFDAMTIPGRDYNLFGSSDLMGSWSSHDSLSATGFVSHFTINKPVTDYRFYCVREP